MSIPSPRPNSLVPLSGAADVADLAARFDAAMADLGPFEPHPTLAVAVSGGADSLTLCLLARRWAADRGGRVLALTVDHGLRPEAGSEARRVGDWLRARGIAHETRRWDGDKPRTGLQAAARDARYRLLAAHCAERGILHLLVAHHADDQVETHLMRAARSSGPVGLAGMSAVNALPGLRLLRPLLGFRRADLVSYLTARGIGWIDDPSNAMTRFERVRVRRRLADEPALAALVAADLRAAGRERRRLEGRAAALAATAVSLDAAGFAWLDRAAFASAAADDAETATVLLSRLILAVGGGAYGPRRDRLAALARRLAGEGRFAGATLGRCRFRAEAPDGQVLVVREARHLPAPREVTAGDAFAWDGRFLIRAGVGLPPGMAVAPLGRDGWASLPRDRRAASGLPAAAARVLPALLRDGDPVALPVAGLAAFGRVDAEMRFRPKNALSTGSFCIAPAF